MLQEAPKTLVTQSNYIGVYVEGDGGSYEVSTSTPQLKGTVSLDLACCRE